MKLKYSIAFAITLISLMTYCEMFAQEINKIPLESIKSWEIYYVSSQVSTRITISPDVLIKLSNPKIVFQGSHYPCVQDLLKKLSVKLPASSTNKVDCRIGIIFLDKNDKKTLEIYSDGISDQILINDKVFVDGGITRKWFNSYFKPFVDKVETPDAS